jgi:hypothetical protein
VNKVKIKVKVKVKNRHEKNNLKDIIIKEQSPPGGFYDQV